MKDIELIKVVERSEADRELASQTTDIINSALNRDIDGLLGHDLVDYATFHIKYGFPFSCLWAD